MENTQPEPVVIFAYTLEEAIADGVLYPQGWAKGLSLIATAAVMEDVEEEERRQLFADFLRWQREIEPQLPEEERLYVAAASNGKKVWVIDDGAAITLLYPSDY